MKRENAVDENEDENCPVEKKGVKLIKLDKGKAIEKEGRVATEGTNLNKDQLQQLLHFYKEEMGITKSVAEIDVPWYFEEALPYYPATSDQEEHIDLGLQRDRTLLFIKSQCESVNTRYLGGSRDSNVDIEVEIFPPSEKVLSIEVCTNGIRKNLKFKHDANIPMDDAIELAISSLPYFDQNFPANVKSPKDVIQFARYENIRLGLKGGSDDVWATLSPHFSLSHYPMKLFRFFVRRIAGVSKLLIYFDTAYFAAYESFGTLPKLLTLLRPFVLNNLERQLAKPELGNTLEFVPLNEPDGFKLSLYDYQKRSLQWMLQVEISTDNSTRDVTRDATTHLFRFDTIPDVLINFTEAKVEKKVTRVMEEVDYSCRGGVLADNPGYGKTIVTLALILANPCRGFSQLGMSPIQKFYMFPSKATLIVCPSNLINQWKEEILKCLPSKIKFYTISCIKEHRALSWADVMFADIILISIKFLSNANYRSFLVQNYGKNEIIPPSDDGVYFARKMRSTVLNRNSTCDVKGQVNFEALYYHRIVFDEFHELVDVEKTSRAMAKNFKGDFYWGMTGTPRFKTLSDIQMTCDFLHLHFNIDSNEYGRALSFKDRFIRRNNEDLRLPPLLDSINWITLSPAEMALYQVRNNGELSEIDAFMACSHYQIAEEVVRAAGESVLTTDQVSKLLYKRLIEQIDYASKAIRDLKKELKDQRRLIALDSFETAQKRVSAIKEVERTEARIEEEETTWLRKQRELQYFQGVMAALEKNTLEDVCLICLDQMDSRKTQLSITKCGHIFCWGCMHNFLNQNESRKACPKCRSPVEAKDVMRMAELPRSDSELAEKDRQTEESENIAEEELAKCGTKVRAMISKLAEIKKENQKAKVIIFVQFRRLASIIMASLMSNGVNVARVHGNYSMRSNSINKFKFDANCSVIMLSTEDSVSGLHLPEATHIFITHPFWFGSGRDMHEKALSAEKQGIARAYRLGLDHPLEIIRFYTKGTIEETVSKERTEL